MKAAIIEKYGSAEEIQIRDDIKKPLLEKNEILIKTCATAMNSMDVETRRGAFKLFTPPGKKKKKQFLSVLCVPAVIVIQYKYVILFKNMCTKLKIPSIALV